MKVFKQFICSSSAFHPGDSSKMELLAVVENNDVEKTI